MKDWRQEEKGTTDDEMVGWHHQLKGHEFEQAPGIGDRQGSLAGCSPGGHRVRHWLSDWTELFVELLCNYVCHCCLVAKLCPPFVIPWAVVADQSPLSMGFFRQESWSGLPFPSAGHLPYLGFEPMSPVLADRFFTTEPPICRSHYWVW